jgi:hypothetical protein
MRVLVLSFYARSRQVEITCVERLEGQFKGTGGSSLRSITAPGEIGRI